MKRVAPAGLPRASSARPDCGRDRPRRRDGQRHPRPHGHDREGVRLDLLGSYEQTDAVVSGTKLVEWSQTGKASVSPEVLERARAARGGGGRGTILDLSGDANQAKILDRDGKAIQGNNPTFGLGVEPEDERFNPFKLVEGDWASGPDQVVIDLNTADDQGYKIGDKVQIAAKAPCARSS